MQDETLISPICNCWEAPLLERYEDWRRLRAMRVHPETARRSRRWTQLVHEQVEVGLKSLLPAVPKGFEIHSF